MTRTLSESTNIMYCNNTADSKRARKVMMGVFNPKHFCALLNGLKSLVFTNQVFWSQFSIGVCNSISQQILLDYVSLCGTDERLSISYTFRVASLLKKL